MLKVSVIVPVYNVEKYLERCLDSLVSQTLEDIEIICINDGSTDKSLEILYKYAEKDERIIVINQKNQGMSYSRNKGIEVATGKYIGFVDSDDYIDKDYYEKLYSVATSYDADIACTNIIRENERKKKVLLNYDNERVYEDTKEKLEVSCVPEYCFVWNKIYNREKLLQSGCKFIKGLFYEDVLYTPYVIEKLGCLVTVKDVFYHYWKRANSIIKTENDKIRADKLFVMGELNKVCEKYGLNAHKVNVLRYKKDYYFLGIKILKVYAYRATKKYYLFGLIPFLTVKEYV